VKKSLYVAQYVLMEDFVPGIDLTKKDASVHQDIPESNVKTVPVAHLLVTMVELAQLMTMGLRNADVQMVMMVISVKQTSVLAKTVDMVIASSLKGNQCATVMMDGQETIVKSKKEPLKALIQPQPNQLA